MKRTVFVLSLLPSLAAAQSAYPIVTDRPTFSELTWGIALR